MKKNILNAIAKKAAEPYKPPPHIIIERLLRIVGGRTVDKAEGGV